MTTITQNTIDYHKMLTPTVVRHLTESIEAAKYEGNEDVCIDSDRIISLFSQTLGPDKYRIFDWDIAEDVIFGKLEELMIN